LTGGEQIPFLTFQRFFIQGTPCSDNFEILYIGTSREDLKKSRAAWIIAAVAIGLSATAIVLINMPSLTGCRSEAPVAAKQYWFRPTQTVVQPWLGPHHVYGMFSVPNQYRRDDLYTARLMIEGFADDFPETSPEGGDIDTGQVKPGHYNKRVYLPTRTALWFVLTGRFGDLNTSCHWWFVIADRMG
jgi:hypothetical protein